jgi:hypothetical protein
MMFFDRLRACMKVRVVFTRNITLCRASMYRTVFYAELS